MTKITFNPDTFEIVFDGHSQFKADNDVVCAATSMLFYTLKSTLEECGEEMLEPGSFECEDEPGKARIKATPKADYKQHVTLIFWVILNGLHTLAENYPDNVGISVI